MRLPGPITTWLRGKDAELSALRRSARTAIFMPLMFAIGFEVLHDPTLATFAAFGSFALLLLTDFSGPLQDRVRAQVSLVVVGGVLVILGTLAGRNSWVAAITMAIVGFGILFAGVVSSTLAQASSCLLLAYILPVSLPGPVSSIPDRLGGWAMAGGASIIAIRFLWPTPDRDRIRSSAAVAAGRIATRLRREADVMNGVADVTTTQRDDAAEASRTAVADLQSTFFATPYKPSGLTASARATVRLVDEFAWLGAILDARPPGPPRHPSAPTVCQVKRAAADLLDAVAHALEARHASSEPTVAAVPSAVSRLRTAVRALEAGAGQALPIVRVDQYGNPASGSDARIEVVSSLEPGFRSQELGYATAAIGVNVALIVAADRRSWRERLIGRRPVDAFELSDAPDRMQRTSAAAAALASAEHRASAHLDRGSVWLHNSVRGGVALGIGVFVANYVGLQHSFWVLLGILSVLRSNALNTGANALRGLAGTVIGFAVGAAILYGIGSNVDGLWALLAPAILVAGVAPAVISFAAGQAAFTVVVVILFNIIDPVGWRVGLVRVEDVAIGCAVSLIVGLVFWPRGANAALARALAAAYVSSARYVRAAVAHGAQRCSGTEAHLSIPPHEDALAAAAAARRLDDAFRSFLAERGTKHLALADVTALITGVAGIRLAADAVLDLWENEDGRSGGDRAGACRELLVASDRIVLWYDELADSLATGRLVPDPIGRDVVADTRLLDALRVDLQGSDGTSTDTATRMIWTGDHLDAVRRLQGALIGPAREVVSVRRRALTYGFDRLPGRRTAHPAEAIARS